MNFGKLFFTNYLIQLIAMGAGFIVSVVIARQYGDSSFSLYVLFVTHLNLLMMFSRTGQDFLVLRETAKPRSSTSFSPKLALKIMLPQVLVLALLYGALAKAGLMGLPESVRPELFTLAMVLAALGQIGIRFVVNLLRGMNRVSLANLFQGLPLNIALMAGLSIYCILIDKPHSQSPIWFYALSALSIGIILLHFHRDKLPDDKSETSAISQWRAGLPFMVIAGTSMLNQSIDVLFINSLGEFEQLGLYNAAQKLSSLISFSLILAVSLVSNRFAAFSSRNDKAQLRKIYVRATALSSAMALAIAIPLLFASDYVLAIWGEHYIAASMPLFLLATGRIIKVFFGPLGTLLLMSGNEKSVLKTFIASVVINILLNFLLVPKYGISGAAAASAIALISQNIMFAASTIRSRILAD